MAAVHSLFRLVQLPAPNTAVSVHRRREQPLPFRAPSILVASERERRVFTTVHTTPIFVRTQHTTPGDVTTTACAVAAHPELTQNATIIPLLKQRREEERRERMRREEERIGREKKSDEFVRTACEEVQTADINTPADSVTSIHATRDFSALSSGARNPWGNIQRRNHRNRPRNSPRTLRHTYHAFQYPAYNYIYKLSPSQPTTPRGVIETIQHPYGIGPAKPVIRIPVAMPITDARPKRRMPSSVTKSSDINFNCCCGRVIQVSKVSRLPHLPISHPILTTLVSDFISHFYSFHSYFFSFCVFFSGIATRALL
jgi:hypothetical protein